MPRLKGHMKSIIIPTGREFLPKTEVAYLEKIQRTERDPKAAARLLAYIMRKKGASVYDIAETLNRPYSTVRDWLMRAMQMGIDGRYDEKRPGAAPRLDARQMTQLKADLLAGPDRCGFESSLWTAVLLAEHIKRKFGVQYGTSGIYEMLHRIGFSRQMPRPRHPKSASKRQKAEFKKKHGAPPCTTAPTDTPSLHRTRHPT